MTTYDLLKSLSQVDPRYIRRTDVFHRRTPGWRVMMKKTTKLALSAAAVVLVLGFILTAWWLQSNYGVGPAQEGEEEPLRICVDLERPESYLMDEFNDMHDPVESFLRELKDYAIVYGGMEDVDEIEIEYIPNAADKQDERNAMLQRIRTEIISGGGPDVFILRGSNYYDESAGLFPYVDKAMEQCFFLPLDEYIENAQFMEWDFLFPEIMAGGRTTVGQVVLPVTFSMPATYFDPEDAGPYPADTTWSDMISFEDPVLALSTRSAWPRFVSQWRTDGTFEQLASCFSLLLPRLVDASTGELAFSEEELRTLTQETLDTARRMVNTVGKNEAEISESKEVDGKRYPNSANGMLTFGVPGDDQRKDQTLVPLYNTGGGATAWVSEYGAVNKNTKRVEDAFFVLDFLLSKSVQKSSRIVNVNGIAASLPVDSRLYSSVEPYQRVATTAHNAEEMKRVISQVTAVRFCSQMDTELNRMLYEMISAIDLSADWPDPATVAEAVHDTYQKLQRLLDES